MFEPELEAGEEEAYAALEDGDIRPIPELDLMEDCNVDCVEEGVIEPVEGVAVVAMFEVGEFEPIHDEEEDGL